MGSYPLLSLAPTHVEVELGCDKIKEEESIGDENELVARNQHATFEIFVTNQSVNPFVDFPKTPNYKFGPEELRKLHFFVDLWHVQKWVQPLGLPNIIPLLECLKNKKSFSKDVITTHIKVGQSLCYSLGFPSTKVTNIKTFSFMSTGGFSSITAWMSSKS